MEIVLVTTQKIILPAQMIVANQIVLQPMIIPVILSAMVTTDVHYLVVVMELHQALTYAVTVTSVINNAVKVAVQIVDLIPVLVGLALLPVPRLLVHNVNLLQIVLWERYVLLIVFVCRTPL